MAAEQETIANRALFMPLGARIPANSAVMIPVRNASCVSTSSATSRAAAANGIAKSQMTGSLNGGPYGDILAATLSPKVKPTFINAVWTSIAEPTKASAFFLLTVSALLELRCSANFHADQ